VLAEGKIREVKQQPSPTSVSAAPHTFLHLIPLKAGTLVLGVLCLRIEEGASWFASAPRLLDAQEQPADQALFFWTFLDEAIMAY
jgi:hypothetical protein